MNKMRQTPITCEEISQNKVDLARKNLLRPGVKAVLFDSLGRVLMCRLPDGYPHRFNFPGGGIDDGESPAVAFVREFEEEMSGPLFGIDEVAKAPVVAEGRLPFPRDEFLGKYEFLIALPVESVKAYCPKKGSKIICFPPLPWDNARRQVLSATQVNSKMRKLYARALSNVPKVM